MLSIRLSRGGSKKKPVYDIVVAEKSFARDGRFVETLGFSSPLMRSATAQLRIDLARYDYWAAQGAAPTDTVRRLVRAYRKRQSAATSGETTADDAAQTDAAES